MISNHCALLNDRHSDLAPRLKDLFKMISLWMFIFYRWKPLQQKFSIKLFPVWGCDARKFTCTVHHVYWYVLQSRRVSNMSNAHMSFNPEELAMPILCCFCNFHINPPPFLVHWCFPALQNAPLSRSWCMVLEDANACLGCREIPILVIKEIK